MAIQIDKYSFGKIVVEGKEYTSDVIIYPEFVDKSWWRKEGHRLSREDIEKVICEKPEILIIGTGASGMMEVPAAVTHYIKAKGIQLIVDTTDNACKAYNKFAQTRKTIALLHLTC